MSAHSKMCIGLFFCFGMVVVQHARAQTPLGSTFTYQGQLKNAGSPANGLHDLRFRLYDALAGGAQVGATVCFDNVSVTDGLFTVPLDFGGQFDGQERFLEINVRADTGLGCGNGAGFVMLSPRQELTAAPHALFALDADQLDGLDATAFLQSVPVPLTLSGTSATHIIRGENSHANGKAIAGYSTATGSGFPQPMGVYGESAATNGRGVVGSAPGGSGFGVIGSGGQAGVLGTGFTGVWGDTIADGGRAVFGSAFGRGQNFGGYFEAMPPIGENPQGTGVYGSGYEGVVGFATNPDGNGVHGTANGPSGWGVLGESLEGFGVRGGSGSGTGVFGVANATTGITYGGRFETNSTTSGASGVFGLATATSGVTNGVYGQSNSLHGNGVRGLTTASLGDGWGVFGESASTSGRGVYGSATAGTGATYGVLGETNSTGTNAAGVVGLANAQSGTTYGVWGQSESSSGFGVIGINDRTGSTVTYGVYGRSATAFARGVYGLATAASGNPIGVLGESNGIGFGLYALGNSGASGVKSFHIDHPDDPGNKYLLHYSTESPEVLNAYSGTIRLDGAGQAVVELPHYFAKINRDPRYTLTAVGAPMPMLHVAEEIDEAALSAGAKAEPGEAAPTCSFRIAGGAPGAKVSWEVKALRNDRWVQQHGAPVEVEKQGLEKGTYQHPDLYGQPAEKGMNYDAERDRPRPATGEEQD